MTLIFHKSLKQALSLMLNNSDDSDVIIQVGENQNIKEFYAHSNILKLVQPILNVHYQLNGLLKRTI
jgi:hypothetical protein